jgi:hypothetical protein
MPDPAYSILEHAVDSLRLAAWLRLNRQRLLERRLQPDGRIIYIFEKSAESEDLISLWRAKSETEIRLARFSAIVSFEIRKAINMRREHGMTPRLTRLFHDDDRDPDAA